MANWRPKCSARGLPRHRVSRNDRFILGGPDQAAGGRMEPATAARAAARIMVAVSGISGETHPGAPSFEKAAIKVGASRFITSISAGNSDGRAYGTFTAAVAFVSGTRLGGTSFGASGTAAVGVAPVAAAGAD